MSLTVSQNSIKINIDKSSEAVASLKNESFEKHLGFKIKCTHARDFTAKPNIGSLKPGESVNVSFSMNKDSQIQPETTNPRFLVEYIEDSETLKNSQLHKAFSEKSTKNFLRISVELVNSEGNTVNNMMTQSMRQGSGMYASMGPSPGLGFEMQRSLFGESTSYSRPLLHDRSTLYQKSTFELCDLIDEKDKSIFLAQQELAKLNQELRDCQNKIESLSYGKTAGFNKGDKKEGKIGAIGFLLCLLCFIIGYYFSF